MLCVTDEGVDGYEDVFRDSREGTARDEFVTEESLREVPGQKIL